MSRTARNRIRWSPGLLAASATLVLAVSVLPGEQPMEPVLDPAGSILPAGTPLADGFVVTEGSALVGDVYPQRRAGQEEESGWTAQLLVTGDPLSVFEEYVAQAGRLGYPMTGGCSVAVPQMSPVALSDPLAKDAHLLQCGAGHDRYYEDGPRDQLSVSVTLYVGERGGLPLRHLEVSLFLLGDGRQAPPEQDDYNALPVTDPVPDLPVLEPVPPPKPGEPIKLGPRMQLNAPVGSTLVASLAPGGVCGEVGYAAVFTTLDVDAALADLERQLADENRGPVEYVVVTGDGVTYRTFTVNPGAGAGIAQVTTAERADRNTILISAC